MLAQVLSICVRINFTFKRWLERYAKIAVLKGRASEFSKDLILCVSWISET